MKKTTSLILNYDKEADVLYASYGRLSKDDIAEELGDDVIAWKDPSGKTKGFTVINFSKRKYKDSLIPLPFEVELKEKISA